MAVPRRTFRRILYRNIFLGFLLAILFGSVIITFFPISYQPRIELKQLSSVPNDLNQTISSIPVPPEHDVVLLSSLPGDKKVGWKAFVENPNPKGASVSTTLTNDSMTVSGAQVTMVFQKYFNIPVDVLDTATIKLDAISGGGTAEIGLQIRYEGLWMLNGTVQEDSFYEGVTKVASPEYPARIQYTIPIDSLRVKFNTWIVQARLSIQVDLSDFATIRISYVNATASSQLNLVPLKVAFAGQDGNLLATSDLTRMAGPTPTLNLTRYGNQSAFVIATFGNATLYVPAGNYSFSPGWLMIGGFYQSSSQIPLEITETGVEIFSRIASFRLEFDLSPKNVPISLWMELYDKHSEQYGGMPQSIGGMTITSKTNHYVYLPNFINRIFVTCALFDIISDSDFLCSIEGEIDGMYNLRLAIYYPLFEIMNLALSLFQVVALAAIVAVVVVFLVTIQKPARPIPIRKIIHRRGVLPIVLFVVSGLLPWGETAAPTGVFSSHIVYVSLYLPVMSQLYHSATSLAIIKFAGMFWPFAFLFWIGVLCLIIYIVDLEFRLTILRLIILLLPGILGLIVIFAPSDYSPSGGAFLAVFATITFLSELVLRRKFSKIVDYAVGDAPCITGIVYHLYSH